MADRFVSRPTLKFAAGELVFNHRLIRLLGRGSFGEVWLATNEKGFEWALKIVSLTGSGGKKEFRALQLIKDRKIKSTHLLKLIDYGLLDRDGTSLVVSPTAEPTPRIVPVPPPVPMRGTLVPQDTINPAARTSIEQLAARDTQHNQTPAHDDLADLHSRAAWLVIVMEVGDRTLHELQLEETRRERSNRASRSTRMVHRSGTVMRPGDHGSNKPSAQTSVQVDDVEEPLAPLAVAKVLTYLDQAARGLDYLHRHDILHRDVKPQNIMLIDADAKLCDYGLASEFRNSSATTEGCSPAYAAPEAINNRPVPASDQYALAVTYVELVSGRWPFFGTTQTAIYREKDEGRHNLTFIRNRSTRRVLARALAKNPEDRYPTCLEFARELAAAEHTPQRSWLGPALKWLAVACFLGALASAGFVFRERLQDLFKRRPPPPPHEILIDPLALISLPEARLNKLETSPVSFVSAEPIGFKRAGEQWQAVVEQHRLLRVIGPEPPPRFDSIFYVTNERFPTRIPQPLAARSVTPVPALPKYVFRNADEELTSLWTAHVNAPDEFLTRFVELIGKSQRTADWWGDLARRAAEQPNWLTACERRLLGWSTEESEANRALRGLSGFEGFATQIKNQGISRMLRSEFKPPVDVAKLISSPAFVLNQDRVITQCLRTDWELPVKGKDEVWVTDRLKQLASLPTAGLGDPAEAQFQSFVISQLQSRRSTSDAASTALAELNKLLASDQLPAWLGPQRRQALARCLGRVIVANIGLNAGDLPRLDGHPRVAGDDLLQLQRHAEALNLAGAESAALRSLTMAVTNESPDWRKVHEDCRTALADAETKRLLTQYDRLLIIEYVAALSQLKLAATATDNVDAALDQIVTILNSRTAAGPRYFDYSSEQQQNDDGVLHSLVLPVLRHPATEKITAAHPQATNLAALYGTQGRILQRKPQATAADWQQAHVAFTRARDLDARSPRQTDYLLGYCTTFAPQPVLSLAHLPRDRQLMELVKKLPSELTAGKTVPANIALLQAHVARMKGEYAEAAERYAAARDARPNGDDPFHLRESALLNLCYVQLEQAQLAPWRESDFQPNALDSPALNTKSYYLSEALYHVRSAESLPKSLQREQVFLAKGLALERQAMAFGLGAKYGEAAAAYQRALEEAQAAQRPAAACRLSLARCYVTGFSDPVLAGTRDSVKADRLQQAIAACTAVIDERVSVELDEAKRGCDLAASYWRGRAREELARLPDQPASSLRTEAARDFRAAISQGKSTTATEVGMSYLALLRATKPASGLHDSGSLMTAKTLLTECLQMLQEEPRNFDPDTILLIAEENRLPATPTVPSPAIVPFISWFSASWPIPEPWTRDDDWRIAGARLASFASTSNANDAFRKAANDLTFSLQDPARKSLAQSYLHHKQLPLQVKAYLGQQNKPAANPAGAALPAATPAGGGGVGQLDIVFQRYFDSVQLGMNPLTRANLAKLNRLPIEKMPGEFQKLAPLQQRLIREHLTRDVTLEDRLRVWELIESAHSGENSGGSAGGRLDQIAHDLLKPMYLLATGDGADPVVAARLKRTTAGLNSIEEKLGIRPKDEPKEKSADKSKSPAASVTPKKS